MSLGGCGEGKAPKIPSRCREGIVLRWESGFTAFYGGSFVPLMKWLAKFFIAMAMCAIGLNTNIVKLIKNGGKPILMGLACWVMITLVSLGVQHLAGIYYSNI